MIRAIRLSADADGALPGTELARRAPATIAKRPATGLARPMAGRRRAVLEAGVIVGRAATHRRTRDAGTLAAPQHDPLLRHRGVGAGAAVVGGAHQRPLRAADARRRGGRGLRAADRLGAARRAGSGTAAPPPDGLDHRAAGPGPHRRRHGSCAGSGSCSGWARSWPSPTATPRGCSPRCRRPWTASRGRCGCSAWSGCPPRWSLPWLVLAGLWQVGRRHGSVPRWAAPDRRPGAPDGDRHPGRGRRPRWRTWASPR